MKRLVLTITLALSASLAAAAQCKDPYAPPGASFSICPPPSIQRVKETPLDFFVRDRDPAKNRFLMTINEESADVSLHELGFGFIQSTYSDKDLPGVVLRQIGDFTAASGDPYLRLVFEKEGAGKDGPRRIQYLFVGPKDKKVIFTVVTTTGSSEETTIADAVIKTVKMKQ